MAFVQRAHELCTVCEAKPGDDHTYVAGTFKICIVHPDGFQLTAENLKELLEDALSSNYPHEIEVLAQPFTMHGHA